MTARTMHRLYVVGCLVVLALWLALFSALVDASAEPTPEPTHTRRDTRPTATANPEHPVIAVSTPAAPLVLPASSRERPLDVTFEAVRLDPVSGVNRVRVWFKTPTQSPAPHTQVYCARIAYLDRTTGRASVRCRLNWRAPRGLWSLCPFSPDEPASAYPGLMENCQQVEVR